VTNNETHVVFNDNNWKMNINWRTVQRHRLIDLIRNVAFAQMLMVSVTADLANHHCCFNAMNNCNLLGPCIMRWRAWRTRSPWNDHPANSPELSRTHTVVSADTVW